MSKDNRIRMPASGGGLVNYYDENTSKVHFKPSHIIILTAAVLFVLLILHNYGYALLGLQ